MQVSGVAGHLCHLSLVRQGAGPRVSEIKKDLALSARAMLVTGSVVICGRWPLEVEGMLDNNDNSKNGAIFGYLWGIVVPQWCGSEGDI